VRFVGVQGWQYLVQSTDTFPAVNWQNLPVNALTVDLLAFDSNGNPILDPNNLPPATNVNSQTGKATWAGLDASGVPNGSVLCGPAFVRYKDLDSVLFPSRFYRCIFFSQ